MESTYITGVIFEGNGEISSFSHIIKYELNEDIILINILLYSSNKKSLSLKKVKK